MARKAGLLQSREKLPQLTGSQGWTGPDGTLDLSRSPAFLAVSPSRDPHARDAQSHPRPIFPQSWGGGGAGGRPLGAKGSETL